MIQKIKELLSIGEEVEQIKNNLKYAASSLEGLKSEVNSLKQQISSSIDDVSAKNSEFFKSFDENLSLMKDIRQRFEEELYQFKLMKGQLQKKVMEKFEEELGKELKLQTESLKNDSQAYNELKENMLQISGKVSSVGSEIGKFMAISGNIKKEDFELARFANKIFEADREKLQLMHKVDMLERMVSKMRRQEYATR